MDVTGTLHRRRRSKDKRMMNATALIIASNTRTKNQLVDRLSATALFSDITPLASGAALLRHLKTRPADMICWAVEEKQPQGTWIDRLQAHEQWHDVPLIAFAENRQSLLSGFELGASDAIHLQIDPQELSARMQCHLQRLQRLRELRRAQEQLQRMALTDPLTGLGNRATFDACLKQTAARSRRRSSPYSLLLIDLDHFKQVNDRHGHQAGDSVLKMAAAAIQNSVRGEDTCSRYGGEEFAVILPDTNAAAAAVLAERIHRQIAALAKELPPTHAPVTVSIGIASTTQTRPHHLLEQADRALYRAKRNGRNRTEIWQEDKRPATLPASPRSLHHACA